MFDNKALFKLIVPLMIEQVLAITVGMADTMMISSAGEAAVSGVSLVDMVNVIFIGVFSSMATGGAVISSQYIGQKDISKACESALQLLIVTLGVSLAVMGVCLGFNKPILRLIFGKIEPDVMESAVIYFGISALSYPFLAIYNSCAALFRSMGNSKISMITSIIMNLINIFGNAVLIFVFDMGVAGAAISSLISRMIAAVIMFMLIRNPKNQIYIPKHKKIKPDISIIKKILYIGIPNGFENSIFQLGRVLVVSIISTFGTVQIAANAVANNIDGLGCIPGQAMNLAMITVIGQCIGARDYEQVKYYTKKLLKITYMITIILNIGILTSLPLILRVYNLSEETIRLATILIFIHNGFAMLLWPLSFTLPNALRAANDVKFTMYVSIFSMFTFRILFSYILAIGCNLGAIGVWLAMLMDWLFRVISFVLRFLGGKWKTKKV